MESQVLKTSEGLSQKIDHTLSTNFSKWAGTSIDIFLASEGQIYNCEFLFFLDTNLFYIHRNLIMKKILKFNNKSIVTELGYIGWFYNFCQNLESHANCSIFKLLVKSISHLSAIESSWSDQYIEYNCGSKKVNLAYSWKLQALHKHCDTSLSSFENEKLYKKCSKLHGHEYSIFIEGEFTTPLRVDPDYITNLEKEVKNNVIEKLEGKYLNSVLGNTSGESLLLYIKNQLLDLLPRGIKWKFMLQETYRNRFSITFST